MADSPCALAMQARVSINAQAGFLPVSCDQLVSGFSLRVLLTSPHRPVVGATTVPQLAVGLVEVTAKVPRSECLTA
jgi:hypothetical protein